jgi:hypothetical protein
MRIIIAGSRKLWYTPEFIREVLKTNGVDAVSEIVCGGASGIDASGKLFGEKYNIPVKMFPADWGTNGRAAGPIRNKQMANYGDALFLVWDGKSPGSKNMLKEMNSLGKIVIQVVITKHQEEWVRS